MRWILWLHCNARLSCVFTIFFIWHAGVAASVGAVMIGAPALATAGAGLFIGTLLSSPEVIAAGIVTAVEVGAFVAPTAAVTAGGIGVATAGAATVMGAAIGVAAGVEAASSSTASIQSFVKAKHEHSQQVRAGALVDAGARRARSATLRASSGIAAGLNRYAWDLNVVEPACTVVASMFDAASNRLCGGSSEPQALFVRANILRTFLRSGVLNALATSARVNIRHHVAVSAISTVTEALHCALRVALTALPPIPPSFWSCRDCTLHNSFAANICAACSSSRPQPESVSANVIASRLIVAAAVSECFVLGESVNEAAVAIFKSLTGIDKLAMTIASSVIRTGPVAVHPIIPALLALSDAMQVWPLARLGRTDSFKSAMALFEVGGHRRVLEVYESLAAQLAEISAPPPLSQSSAPPLGSQAAADTAAGSNTSSGSGVALTQLPPSA